MVAAITAGLSILAIILEMVVQYRDDPARNKEAANADTQKDRNAIGSGDAVVLNHTLDGLLSDVSVHPEGTAADSATGQYSDTGTAKSINNILGT